MNSWNGIFELQVPTWNQGPEYFSFILGTVPVIWLHDEVCCWIGDQTELVCLCLGSFGDSHSHLHFDQQQQQSLTRRKFIFGSKKATFNTYSIPTLFQSRHGQFHLHDKHGRKFLSLFDAGPIAIHFLRPMSGCQSRASEFCHFVKNTKICFHQSMYRRCYDPTAEEIDEKVYCQLGQCQEGEQWVSNEQLNLESILTNFHWI